MAERARPAAVVFDCDGVLANTEEAAWHAWTVALADQDQPALTAMDIAALTGPTKAENLVYLGATRQPIDLDRLLADFEGHHGRVVETRLRAYPDTVAAVFALAASGVPMAVASNSPAAWVELVIASTGTPPVFRAIVTIEDVDRPKPAPDLYAEAVRQLGVSGVATVAVEDSPTGIAAARAAGLAVLGVRRGYFDDDELAAAHLLVDEVDVTAIEIALAKAVER